ncbi:MAG: 5'-nucleotidase C-terminal domain-containing protein [Deltaproteobacteria bacterium]|nr:5'-nucleotidase C-terminal domain-containing protein [Deltaproteobacteria bacterium]
MKIRVSGRTLLGAFEHALSELGPENNRFPHLSGAALVYDPQLPPYSRVVKATVGGRPLDPSAHYTLIVDTFIRGGGDGFAFGDAVDLTLPADARAKVPLLVEALRGKTIEPRVLGRCEALLTGRLDP